MHGVKRQTQQAIADRKQREKSKIEGLLKLTDAVLARKKGKDWSAEAFDATTQLLTVNPEFYTIWNYRRNILLNGLFRESTPEDVNELLSGELVLTMKFLQAHPKVYWIWNHRQWCLQNVPQGPGSDVDGWRKKYWSFELQAVEKMLSADARNFHAWNYRRYVLANMPVPRPESSELTYTMKKIESNFSNFSAWHQRSKVYTSLWHQGKLDPVKSKEKEFELVRNAMYTDPDDQSIWMYHRWLVGLGHDKELLEREIGAIQELLEEQPDSKWCMESLVHYKRLILTNYSSDRDSDLVADCVQLLEQLKEIDSARRHRYEEIRQAVESIGSLS
ncbi:rab-protein geranylgeranyltransferase [Pleurotus eryngii]|uniref:Geranylgeranyl transferase type-2 subunit alpha n=1 Tax=Pleurotus eryngii TaxID=5323 RepID=A0A9P6A7C4_PLEER|nr:rab-protein geranylgeranyltransferase [Pleurotus eryngii]